MCTALSLTAGDHYFGRNLDLDGSCGEQVLITPRNHPLPMRDLPGLERHYAMIGMGLPVRGYPLYFDAVNEHGLAAAGLNFPGCGVYRPPEAGRACVASFELIPWVLGQCRTVEEAEALLRGAVITDRAFSPDLPPTPEHWMISDAGASLVVEPTAAGLILQRNPVGVLTNSPELEFHLWNLRSYCHMEVGPAENRLAPGLDLAPCWQGSGAVGLPGDLSSPSRFVRCAFHSLHWQPADTEEGRVGRFFRILDTVAWPVGSVQTAAGRWEYTVYTACCNATRGIYYYTTETNRRITAVRLHDVDLDGTGITVVPLRTAEDIRSEGGAP